MFLLTHYSSSYSEEEVTTELSLSNVERAYTTSIQFYLYST